MSRTLVKRVSRVIDRRAGGRRSFLRTSAMAATALAVAPVAYAIRPHKAEAAIVLCHGFRCQPGALCCDGYTEFCCKLTGENLCPPDTIVAGWWKADGSGFCDLDGPAPRYYLDCNHVCDPDCRCTAPGLSPGGSRGSNGVCSRDCTSAKCECSGGCDTRRSGCLNWRYGQCNQDVCVGPLLCRIVTCVPPWKWDTSCAATPVLTDQGTGFHDRPCLHEGFTDIPPKAYYAEAVEWMAAEGIADGLKEDLFGPDKPVTRAQFATFLWRYRGRPTAESSTAFSDIKDDDVHAQAVNWMVSQRVAVGVAPYRFAPQRQVTRAQAVVFLHRLEGQPEGSASIDFADVPEDAWYRDALQWALQHNITWWSQDAIFQPDKAATRAEVAALIYVHHRRLPAAPIRDRSSPAVL